jgi:hypothetical protein
MRKKRLRSVCKSRSLSWIFFPDNNQLPIIILWASLNSFEKLDLSHINNILDLILKKKRVQKKLIHLLSEHVTTLEIIVFLIDLKYFNSFQMFH